MEAVPRPHRTGILAHARSLRRDAEDLISYSRTLRHPGGHLVHIRAALQREYDRGDLALNDALSRERWSCGGCLARHAGLTQRQVADALERTAPTVEHEDTIACCGQCGRDTVVHRVR